MLYGDFFALYKFNNQSIKELSKLLSFISLCANWYLEQRQELSAVDGSETLTVDY
jgi:hypothetical protein